MAQRKIEKTEDITKAGTVWKVILAGVGAVVCLIVAHSLTV